MIIVIEGVDETGKTTLAEQLVELTGATLLHFGPPEGHHPLDQYGLVIERHARGEDLILDRFHWGELVYGPHYRGKSTLGREGFAWMEALLASRGAVTILMDGDPDKIYERVVASDDDFVRHDRNHLEKLRQSFRKLAPDCWTPLHVYNIDHFPMGVGSQPNPGNIVRWVRHREENFTDLWWRWPRTTGFIRRDYGILLVGEQPADPEGEHKTPFTPYDGTCGQYLLEALCLYKVGSWALANALAPDGAEEDLLGYWLALGAPPTVALGQVAHRVLSAQGVPHTTTYHPQYVKRFHYDRKPEYGMGIIQAAVLGEDFKPWT